MINCIECTDCIYKDTIMCNDFNSQKTEEINIFNQEDRIMINGKKEEKTEATQAKYTVKVTRAREIKKTEKEQVISFDVNVNNVTIYGMIYRSGVSAKGKDYELISFPARKGSDDTYYNHCWFGITKDLQEDIKEQIGGALNV